MNGGYGKTRGKGEKDNAVTRRRLNERKDGKQGRQRGGGLLAFCSQFPKKLDKIHAVVLTSRKRNGGFDVVQHDGGIPGGVLVPGFGRGRENGGISAQQKASHAEKQKGPVRAFDFRVRSWESLA